VGKPYLIEHALDGAFKALPAGVFDLETVDEVGILNGAWLHNQHDYAAMLRKMRDNKRIDWDDATIERKAAIAEAAVIAFHDLNPHFSSGALPQRVEVDEETGHIKTWYRIECSGTVTPAEPNGTAIASIKSAFHELKALLSSRPDDTPQPYIQPDNGQHGGGNTRDGESARKDAPQADVEPAQANGQSNETTPAKEVEMFPEEQIRELIRVVLAEYGITAPGEQVAPLPTEDEVLASVRADAPKEEPKDDEEVAKAVAKLIDAIRANVKAYQVKRQKMLDAGREYQKRTAPALDTLPAGGNGSGASFGHSGNGRIEMTNLKYAGLNAGEMALGLLMAAEPMHKLGMKGVSNLSDDYVRNMAGKAHDLAWRDNQGLSSDQKVAFKSVVPYKANELDASNIVGQGYEWVSQFWSTTIWETARYTPTLYDIMVKKGMMVKEIPQGAGSAYFPTEGSDPVVYTAPEANSVDVTGRPEVTVNISPFGTGRIALTPKELKLGVAVTYILEEDSIIDVVKQVNYQTSAKMLETRDQVLINGDTETAADTNINLIDGTPGVGLSTPYYINSNGLRKLPLVTNTALKRDGGALTLADYLATLGLLAAVLRTDKSKSLFIVDPQTELASLALPELATDDVRHTNATITSGEILNIYGRDVVVSGFLPLTNTAGKVSATASNNLYGTILAVYAPYWAFGWKRQITVESQRMIESGATLFVTSCRFAVAPRGTTGSALSYNLTV
jgi:hypothetical protein